MAGKPLDWAHLGEQIIEQPAQGHEKQEDAMHGAGVDTLGDELKGPR